MEKLAIKNLIGVESNIFLIQILYQWVHFVAENHSNILYKCYISYSSFLGKLGFFVCFSLVLFCCDWR